MIDDKFILISALVLYLLGLYLGFKTKTYWINYGASLLWMIPITMIENTWIVLFSAFMLLATIFFTYFKNKGDTYE